MPLRYATDTADAMRSCAKGLRLAASLLTALGALLGAPAAQAQAWIYPSFQQPHWVNREFTLAVADGGYDGTSFIFQWREELVSRSQMTFDGGFATGVDGHSVVFLGALYGYQVLEQRDSNEIEMLATGGLTLSFGHGGPFTRLPFAASIGHRFGFDNGVALTPYVRPQVSLDFCGTVCIVQVRGGTATAGVGATFGLGANLELSRRFSVRIEGDFNRSTIGPLDNTIGIGVAWSPEGLQHL